jgi:ankyrin repeat protein
VRLILAAPHHCKNHACWYGTLEIVQYLVEMAGANVHAVDETSSTPLHYANIGGKVDIIKYLVESAGANILGPVLGPSGFCCT